MGAGDIHFIPDLGRVRHSRPRHQAKAAVRGIEIFMAQHRAFCILQPFHETAQSVCLYFHCVGISVRR